MNSYLAGMDYGKWIYVAAIVLFGCGPSTNEDPEAPQETIEPHVLDINAFRSELRPDQSEWSETEEYTDTLEFDVFNDDYDYWSGVFRTKEGSEVWLNTSDPIEGVVGKNYVVTWKVGKFYEAGEGDQPYYQEQFLSMTPTRSSYSFEKFMDGFIKAYTDTEVPSMDKWTHGQQPLVSLGKMGVYCITTSPDSSRWMNLPGFNTISSEELKGHMCEGYEGVKDGYYYEFINAKDIPGYADMAGEGRFVQLELPKQMRTKSLIRVRLVEEYSFERDLYFYFHDINWYYWIENNCGCSA